MAVDYLIYDIETYKSDRAEEYWQGKDVKPDARLKDPEKIEADIAKKREQGLERSALSPITGRITMVGTSYNGNLKAFTDPDERKLLEDLDIYVSGKNIDEFVGKNNRDFDLPYLRLRHMVNNLRMPTWLLPNQRHRDIKDLFGRNMGTYGPSLADLEFALDIRRDGEKDALQALTWWEEGDLESLERYCLQDVSSTESIYLMSEGYNANAL